MDHMVIGHAPAARVGGGGRWCTARAKQRGRGGKLGGRGGVSAHQGAHARVEDARGGRPAMRWSAAARPEAGGETAGAGEWRPPLSIPSV